MRFMILGVLALAAFVLTLAVCAPLRLKVEDALFAKESAPADAVTTELPRAQALPEAPGPIQQVPEGIRDLVDGSPPSAPPAPEQAVAQSSVPEPPPSRPEPRQADEVLKPWERVVLPPYLRQVQFGMPSEQIRRGYPVAWTKEEVGESTLVHYPSPDKSTTVRFQFSGDSLYRIEVWVKPGQGQTRKQLYDSYKAQYAELYARVPERSEARWSDGTVTAQIKRAREEVELVFTCPTTRR